MTDRNESTTPWYVWCAVVAVTSAMVGMHWDIAWHRSIGRDTFWTPAHMAIYLAGVLGGLSCGYLILSTTFAKDGAARTAAVKIWGFYGPLGAFICAWGGVAMITSAPFDDWWHNAYGLDVRVLSPPHVVLGVGIIAIEFGALILTLGRMNRASDGARDRLNWIFLYVAAMILVCLLILIFEYNLRIYMHGARFYRVVSMVIPIVLAAVSRASGRRWACTMVISFYSIFVLLMLWLLPLAPAETKLGPVYRQVTHLVPGEFPLLLIVPAILLDLLFDRIKGWNKWLQSALAGATFLIVFAAVQWPFANFLMSPAARNWFFGAMYFDYNLPPTSYYVRNLFLPTEETVSGFWWEMSLAAVWAMVMMRVGMASGDWMRRIRR